MKRLILIISLLIATPASAGPLDTIREVRASYPNLPGNRVDTYRALREIAASLNLGLLKKPSGNRCPKSGSVSKQDYSCDFLCDREGNGYDIFRDWENRAEPIWLFKKSSNPASTLARCEFFSAPPDSTPTPVPTPGPDPALMQRLAAIEAILEAISEQVARLADPLSIASHEARNAAERAARIESTLQQPPAPPTYRGRVLGFPVTLRPEQVQ